MGRELTEITSILLLPLALTPSVFGKDLCIPAITVPLGTENLEEIGLILFSSGQLIPSLTKIIILFIRRKEI